MKGDTTSDFVLAVLVSIPGLILGTLGIAYSMLEWNWELVYLIPMYLLMILLSTRVLSIFIVIPIERFSGELKDIHVRIVEISIWFLAVASATYLRFWLL